MALVYGILFINNADGEKAMNITSSIENIQSLIKQGDSIDKGILLNNCLKQNIIVVILIWFIGCTIIGIPILFGIILYKGFCIGYTISAVIATTEFRKAISFIMLSLLPQNIIIIPTILLITVSGIKLYRYIMKDKNKDNIKIELIRHTIISLIALVAIIIASFIEVYISTNLLLFFKDFL